MPKQTAPEKPAVDDPKPIANIVTTKERQRTVDLDWPVEFDGKVYDKVTVRRVTGREVEEFMRQVDTRDVNAPFPRAPMIDCPTEVYEALDDDDLLRVEEAMVPFLPQRLQRVTGSTPPTSDTTSEK
jgi:hypothetical protein